MELAMVGLGKMGANMTERLVKGGHRVVGYDLNPQSVQQIVDVGAERAVSLEDLAGRLPDPQIVWIMVPSGAPVDETIAAVLPFLRPGAVIVDGGNSNYRDTLRRAEQCDAKGVHFVDCGTSGGIWGLSEGYSMMVGGDQPVVENLNPIFETLAPAPDRGWGRVGPAGSGHFVKMIHNGIEYGLMQAYAEGLAIMEAKDEFRLDLHQVAEIWCYGSVVRSWLLDLTSEALAENPTMEGIAPFVPDSGEGRWAVFEAIDLNVAAPIITNALFRRISSRDEEEYADRVLSAMRHKFGGHAIKSEVGC
ncbi:MAG: phosphogluconate dehydrogenase (NAD(+)-dependent, decarboxylating) [Acidimicrobiia bacterium]